MSSNPQTALRSILSNRTLLVIDDNEAVRTALDVLFSLHGARVVTAATPAEGLAALAANGIDLVIQDMNFRREATGGEEGVALFHDIRRRFPEAPIILLTAWTHLETAVELVKAGAADYIAKPWDDDRLLTTIRNLLDLRAARAEAQEIRAERKEAREALAERFDLCGIVYESESMHTLVAMATQVAHADVPVLITGPNGAGKEVLADIVEANSTPHGATVARPDNVGRPADGRLPGGPGSQSARLPVSRPYLKVNLGALPNDLIEAELFGTEAGAFTGAKARIGRFEAADGGTLFLDEIGNLAGSGQAKLLRVLQTGELERLGSNTTRRTRVRVIAATNTNLRAAIREGRFREDLFYRLNVIELELTSLAERRDDILALARHFLQPGFALSADAESALTRYPWPGNVRELQNVIRRACLLSPERTIGVAALNLPSAPTTTADETTLDRTTIEQALTRAQGVVAQAARDLGLSRQALYRRMEKLRLKAELGRPPESV